MLVVNCNEQPTPLVLKMFRLDHAAIRPVRDKRRRAGRETMILLVGVSEPSAEICEPKQSVDLPISGTLSFS